MTDMGSQVNRPSLAVKMGHTLRKCCNIAIRSNDDDEMQQVQRFLLLMDSEWADKVSKHALSKLHTDKFIKKNELPLTADLVQLVIKLRQGIARLLQQPKPLSSANYRRLQELVLVR
jgi:CRISPR/Cas system-associated exonuclease Cas4 (RecB family)